MIYVDRLQQKEESFTQKFRQIQKPPKHKTGMLLLPHPAR
jgi:hypothetical protein